MSDVRIRNDVADQRQMNDVRIRDDEADPNDGDDDEWS